MRDKVYQFRQKPRDRKNKRKDSSLYKLSKRTKELERMSNEDIRKLLDRKRAK